MDNVPRSSQASNSASNASTLGHCASHSGESRHWASAPSTGATSRANCSPSVVRVILPSWPIRRSVVPVVFFKLANLAVQGGALDADLACGVQEAGLSREREDPADALLSAGAGERVPDRWRERGGTAEAGQGVGMAVGALLDGNAPRCGPPPRGR